MAAPHGGVSGIRNSTGPSGGGDIPVGDANPYVLKANKNHKRSSNYNSVISSIESASFADPLNASTVFESGSPDAADTINAHSASDVDWYFANSTGSGTLDTINMLGGTHDTPFDL